MFKRSNAIGIFDSGVGGLAFVKSLSKLLPNEKIFYLADTINLPYGNKSSEELKKISSQNLHFLSKFPVKALVVACNTAAAHMEAHLGEKIRVPIFDVITPSVEQAAIVTRNQKIAVLATESTIASNIYETLLQRRLVNSSVMSIACPLLVSAVEDKMLSSSIAKILVSQYLEPLRNSNVDTVILGCTHYSLLKDVIRRELDPSIEIVDSGSCSAQVVKDYLVENNLCSTSSKNEIGEYFVSGDTKEFDAKCSLFLEKKIVSKHLNDQRVIG